MKSTCFSIIPILLVVAGFALSSPTTVGAQTSSKAVVTVDPSGPAAPVAAGETFTATIALNIRSGYHINAQKPSEDYLIGTNVSVRPPKGFSVVRSTYPKARMGRFSFSETPLAVYDGNAQIVVTLKADSSVAAGKATIPAKVEFQACNDDQCLPPSTVDVSFTVEVSDAGASEDTQTLTVTGAPPDARISIDGKAAGVANAQGRAVIRDVTAGRRTVRVEATGFAPFEKDVDVTADAPATIAATLVPATNANTNIAVNTNVNPTSSLPMASSSSNGNSMTPAPASDSSGWLLWVLGGVIVAALAGIGVVAATRGSSARR